MWIGGLCQLEDAFWMEIILSVHLKGGSPACLVLENAPCWTVEASKAGMKLEVHDVVVHADSVVALQDYKEEICLGLHSKHCFRYYVSHHSGIRPFWVAFSTAEVEGIAQSIPSLDCHISSFW
jgi:hypothetical protein